MPAPRVPETYPTETAVKTAATPEPAGFRIANAGVAESAVPGATPATPTVAWNMRLRAVTS